MTGQLQLVEALRSLRSAPWDALLRRLGVLPSRPDAGARLALAPDAPDGRALACSLARRRLLPPGETDVPVAGRVAWELPASWSVDPVSGHDFDRGASRRTRARPDVEGADLLRTWARARHVDVLHAARHAAWCDDAVAAAHVEATVGDFVSRNPPGLGPHWASAMEVALRAVRLLHAASLLETVGVDGAEAALGAVRRSLLVHEHWLLRHDDWRLHRTGNHYLVALAGRYLLAEHLEGSALRRRVARRDWSRFWRELVRQVGRDGLHFESSIAYHLLVAEAAAHVLASGRRAGRETPEAARDRLRAMAEATAALARRDGSLAAVGDCDDATFVETPGGGSVRDLEDARPVLGLLAAATGSDSCLARASGPAAVAAVAWLFGAERAEELRRARAEPAWRSALFAGGGLAVLATGDGRAHATVSLTGPGRGGSGGHAHDDAGSYALWLDGPAVVERGTGSYTGDLDLRRECRSPAAHSVVQVDGRDQNPPVPGHAFRRRERAWPFVVSFGDDEDGGRVEVGHHGYFVPPGRVSVLRRLELSAPGRLVATDDIRGAGEHEIVLRIHWVPGAIPEAVEGRPDELTVQRPGRGALRVTFEARGAGEAVLPLAPTRVELRHRPRMGDAAGVAAWTSVVRLRARLPLRLRHAVSRASQIVGERRQGVEPE